MKLVIAPDDFLERQLSKFDYAQHDPLSIGHNMAMLMDANGGLGLAANQVKFDGQIFVMKPLLNKTNTIAGAITIINPTIKEISEEVDTGVEGCLSYPGVFLNVSRPRKILVEFDTLTSADNSVIHVEHVYEDIDARIFLHEYDHLSGIQFVDRVSALKRKMAIKKVLKQKRRN
jgi:peptide deformylase